MNAPTSRAPAATGLIGPTLAKMPPAGSSVWPANVRRNKGGFVADLESGTVGKHWTRQLCLCVPLPDMPGESGTKAA